MNKKVVSPHSCVDFFLFIINGLMMLKADGCMFLHKVLIFSEWSTN